MGLLEVLELVVKMLGGFAKVVWRCGCGGDGRGRRCDGEESDNVPELEMESTLQNYNHGYNHLYTKHTPAAYTPPSLHQSHPKLQGAFSNQGKRLPGPDYRGRSEYLYSSANKAVRQDKLANL